ncbi:MULTISPECIES: WhiB family transcriptional regulator [Rhodococcus]|jgi:WhiB family redox-sensing transcriptional regulator|uniref:WhiB family transcriptional regulator n=1 Tax=Rhodococcus TaxID=1827 RepID=UPI0009BE32BF|nr:MULTISPECIES: WhiB family transcriptional regulator [Rhodococcus]
MGKRLSHTSLDGHAWDWQSRALCRFYGAEMFFAPEVETRGARARREQLACSICMSCSVRGECGDYALAAGETHGIWGAMTEHARRRAVNRSTGRDTHSPHRSGFCPPRNGSS